ncbi:RNA-directed DNA polymerase, eukaryota [Tanacetum coccineum]
MVMMWRYCRLGVAVLEVLNGMEQQYGKLLMGLVSDSLRRLFYKNNDGGRKMTEVCNDYGVVVDAFIPYKKSKAGKRFASIRFIKVDNIDRLVVNLCTIWIGRFHLYANVARFHKERKPSAPSHPSNANEQNSPGSYVSILKLGKTNNVMSDQVLSSLILDDSESSDDEEDAEDNGSQYGDKVTADNDVERVSESSCMHNNDLHYDNNHNNIMPDKEKVLSDNPFNLYDILNKRKDSGDDLKYPPGFTPSVTNVEEMNKKVKGATSNEVNEHVNSISNKLEESFPKGKLSSNNSVCSKRVHTNGLILQLMDELVKVGQTMGYNIEGCMRNIEVIISSQGECNVETKMESMDLVTIKTSWGNSFFDYALSSFLGISGCILCVWEPTLFVNDNVTLSNNFLAVMESLIDLHIDGYAYTWAHKTANKMSEVDRFLVSKSLLALFSYLSALCLDINLSDHRPILMRELSIDYVPTPFRFFLSWFNLADFEKMVEDTWKSLAIIDSNGMINLKKKLQALKIFIKQWTKNAKKSSYKVKISIQSKLSDIDKFLDQGGSNEETLSDRSLLLKELNDINFINSLEATHKSKVR